MRVDVVDVLGGQTGVGEGTVEGARGAVAVGARGGEVVGVAGGTEPGEVGPPAVLALTVPAALAGGWGRAGTTRSSAPACTRWRSWASPPATTGTSLLADPDVRRLDRWYPLTVAVSRALPPALVLAVTRDGRSALVTFFWASLVRYAVVHHVTWSVNSVAHAFGEGWHNLHHADPNSARHGGLRGQPDLTAWLIARFERRITARLRAGAAGRWVPRRQPPAK